MEEEAVQGPTSSLDSMTQHTLGKVCYLGTFKIHQYQMELFSGRCLLHEQIKYVS